MRFILGDLSLQLLIEKLKEVFFAVFPITVLVAILNFTIAPVGSSAMIKFIIGAVMIVMGLSLFLFGVDISVTPIGNLTGAALTKTNKIWLIAIGSVILGFLVSLAEPDLHVLAKQVDAVTSGGISYFNLLIVVSIGIAIFFSIGLIRIVYNFPLFKMLAVIYGFILVIAIFATPEFLAISFDASGATTGAMAVPFILAISTGISAIKKDSKASEKDSFGLVAVASTGAILSVMIMSILSKTDKIEEVLPAEVKASESIIGTFVEKLPTVILEVFIALLPFLLMFLVFQKISFKLKLKPFLRILKGLVYTLIGLILFLLGVYAGFIETGNKIGFNLSQSGYKGLIVFIGFILGFFTILAEPAVHVLTHQIENVTSGYITRKSVLTALSLGVGVSISLSMVRIIVPGVVLWHFLLPGYLIALGLMFFTPKLFVGIAFDSGGVASGPMTATFILAFTQGVAGGMDGASILVDGFGVIAMVALTPLIALQVLGLIYKAKSKKKGISDV